MYVTLTPFVLNLTEDEYRGLTHIAIA